MPDATVASLHVHPVKSAGGVAVDEAFVSARGLEHDRRWMLVDRDARFLSQRAHPRLALVRTRLEDGRVRCARPGAPDLVLPAAPPEDAPEMGVEVWGDRVRARSASQEAHAWFSDHLGLACRLVHMPDHVRRPVDPSFGREGDVVSFADGYPVLLAEEASLEDLNARLDEPVPMDRFRPNLVVAGTAPYAADGWSRIRVGAVPFRVVKPCARCVVTTVDQATGRAGGEAAEPLRTLATYRRSGSGVVFGQNLVPDGHGTVRVGDPVEVLG